MTICFAAALYQGFCSIYESFSQGATSVDWDWPLRLYLAFGGYTFVVFLVSATNRAKSFRFFGIRVRWWLMYLISALSFVAVGATNVADYSISVEDYGQGKIIAHFIATGLVAASCSVIAWHYFKKGTMARTAAMSGIIIGNGAFLFSLLKKGDWLTTAKGETIITIMILALCWVMANEINKDQMEV